VDSVPILMPDNIEPDLCFAEGPPDSIARESAGAMQWLPEIKSAGAVQWMPEICFEQYSDNEEEGDCDFEAVSAADSSPSRRMALLAGTDSTNHPDFQCVVKNTFIDIAMPPSPRDGAQTEGNSRRRSKSLPKDMGSPKRKPRATQSFEEIEEEDIFDESPSPKKKPSGASTFAPPLRFSIPKDGDPSTGTPTTESDEDVSYDCELGSGDEVATTGLSRRRVKCRPGAIGAASTARSSLNLGGVNSSVATVFQDPWTPGCDVSSQSRQDKDWGRLQWERPGLAASAWL